MRYRRKRFVHTAAGRVEIYTDSKVCMGCAQNFGKSEGFYNCRTCGHLLCELCCSDHSEEPETCEYQSKLIEEAKEKNRNARRLASFSA